MRYRAINPAGAAPARKNNAYLLGDGFIVWLLLCMVAQDAEKINLLFHPSRKISTGAIPRSMHRTRASEDDFAMILNSRVRVKKKSHGSM